LGEVIEAVLSPLKGTTTSADLGAIELAQGRFTIAVICGIVATLLYVPAFLGLANACLARSPRLARFGGCVAVASMAGFMGVRMMQGVELQAVRDGLDRHTAAELVDHVASNPIGIVMLALFLGGTVIGVVSLAVASWRAGLPRPAVVLLLVFPFVDLAAKGHAGAVVSHVVLLVALTWFAVGLSRNTAMDRTLEGQVSS